MSLEAARRKDLARIHLGKKQVGLDDEAYRDLLKSLTGKISAAALNFRERNQVITALETLGAKSPAKAFPGRPAPQRGGKDALIQKIEAQLTEAKRPWAYAHAMAKRMFQVDQVHWCDADQLRRIVAALNYDARRQKPSPAVTPEGQ